MSKEPTQIESFFLFSSTLTPSKYNDPQGTLGTSYIDNKSFDSSKQTKKKFLNFPIIFLSSSSTFLLLLTKYNTIYIYVYSIFRPFLYLSPNNSVAKPKKKLIHTIFKVLAEASFFFSIGNHKKKNKKKTCVFSSAVYNIEYTYYSVVFFLYFFLSLLCYSHKRSFM